ncbi:nucleoside hydrolase [Corynebacterium liangguodongii]|uniref:Nucleoside hydrolase n=1 Tax=Corynebacterium liangguodongii TaxID=2079535 RepID=A0A2S0WH85_9CORY|nr:nucleoside hydrolase [Corynebacterium liangguodongii]AWB85042.1 nucleoside hydrolase [Corynebacterium liangguodongii]PWB98990.1 nucleoside hydrolase [Corynebacterium liangguodongii]
MKRVIIDCDPGIDDSLALIYLAALHHEGAIELEAVTTSAGNVGAEQCAINAAWVLAQCGLRTVSLAAGLPGPLVYSLTTTPETHGPTGVGYATAPDRHVEHDWDALWCDAIERSTEDLHLIVTGPLTNLAAFAQLHPGHFARLRHITVMGGAFFYPGNTTPSAEWNFWVDPHAAAEVFSRTPVPVTVCSLGLTEQMVIDPAALRRCVDTLGPAPIAAELGEMMRFYFEFHDEMGEGYLAQVHDLLTAQVALGALRVDAHAATVDVEADSELMRGTSVEDTRGFFEREANAVVVTGADIEQAHREFLRACEVHAKFFGGSRDLERARDARAED